jgi:hypothetical protein
VPVNVTFSGFVAASPGFVASMKKPRPEARAEYLRCVLICEPLYAKRGVFVTRGGVGRLLGGRPKDFSKSCPLHCVQVIRGAGDRSRVRDRLPCNPCAARVAEAVVSRRVPSHGHLSRYAILTWNIKEGLPYATAYHSPSAPIMKYTSCW